MKNEFLFTEKQRFSQWWLWLILISINGIFVVGLYIQFIKQLPFGSNPITNTELILVSILIVFLTLLFVLIRLETAINKGGIYVKFYPFQLQFQLIGWESVSKSYVRRYSPLKEFGGWGIRQGFCGKGKAYTVSGSIGLQIELTTGKRILIGTAKADELIQVLESLGYLRG